MFYIATGLPKINCFTVITIQINPQKPKISKTQVRIFGTEFNIQHQLPTICYGPPGLPPKYPLRRHDTPWQVL